MTDTWRHQAACKGQPHTLFLPDPFDRNAIEQAKAICATCPVQVDCLLDAMREEVAVGIRAGLTAAERLGQKGSPSCGTEAGAVRHRKRGEDPCDRCRYAHAVYNAERRAAKREAS